MKTDKRERVAIWQNLPICSCCDNGMSDCNPHHPCKACASTIEFILTREQTLQKEAWIDGKATGMADAEVKVAEKIFDLAQQYAQDDPTMRGSEELRGYHYFNAIHKIGKFPGR